MNLNAEKTFVRRACRGASKAQKIPASIPAPAAYDEDALWLFGKCQRAMRASNSESAGFGESLAQYPLLTALRERRSRRFGLGMKIPGGPLAFQSRHQPASLTEDEEAALVFAACGITGHALADLCYAEGEGA